MYNSFIYFPLSLSLSLFPSLSLSLFLSFFLSFFLSISLFFNFVFYFELISYSKLKIYTSFFCVQILCKNILSFLEKFKSIQIVWKLNFFFGIFFLDFPFSLTHSAWIFRKTIHIEELNKQFSGLEQQSRMTNNKMGMNWICYQT